MDSNVQKRKRARAQCFKCVRFSLLPATKMPDWSAGLMADGSATTGDQLLFAAHLVEPCLTVVVSVNISELK